MPKLLLDLTAAKGLNSGFFPSADPSAGMPWKDGRNAWFKELGVEKILGRVKQFSTIAGGPKAITQAFVEGEKRIYYEDGANIYYWNGVDQTAIDSLSPGGTYWLEPFGNFLLVTDGITQPRIWRNTGAFVPIGVGQFSRAKILKKLGEHVIAYSTDVYPAGMHWSDTSNPEQWDPAPEDSRANFLPFRDLDSEVMAVANLGATHAVYSREAMQIVQFIGGDEVFGRPTQGLQGVGAVGTRSVVSLDRFNFGIGKGGVYQTDGTSVVYVDRPAVDSFLQESVDWSKGEEVVGYHDERLKMVVWSLPLAAGGTVNLGIDAARNLGSADKQITFIGDSFSAAAERVVFDNPIIGMPDGVYFASVPGTKMPDIVLASHLYSPDPAFYTLWDFLLVGGTIPVGEVRFGFTDTPTMASLEWTPWLPLTPRVPIPFRESIYIAMELQVLEDIRITSLKLYGETAGPVL